MVVDKTIDSSSMPKSIEKARIMLIDDDLEGRTTRTGSQININSPKLMMSFKKEETEEIRSKVKHIIESGANVVFSRKGINTLAQHLLAREGIISVRRVKENDLLWLARATGASIAARLDHEHEVHYGSDGHDHDHHSHEHKHAHTHSERYSTRHDDFHPHYHHGDIDIKLGFAERVSERVIGDDRMVFVESCRNPRAVTILLRAGSKRTLDEFQRSTIDGISVLRDYFTKPAIISGGGSAEAAIAKRLRNTANSIPSREQIVLSMFADALEEIPLTLARNAGMDVINTLATLRHEHRDDNRGHTGRGKTYGVDVFGRKVSQMYPAVVEPVLVKEQVLKTATEVANLLLRVDDVLMAKPAMNTHTHANGTTHSHGGGDKAHQHDYFDRLGKMQRPSHHYY
jgi:chaperonin GroEL (HSP60 family)